MIQVKPYIPSGSEWKKFDDHPASKILPRLLPEEMAGLRKSIVDYGGLMQPITLSEDHRVLDGRHRLIICREEDIAPRFEVVYGLETEADFDAFVAEHAVVGRTLDASQKAFYVVKYILPQEEREAVKRMAEGGGDKKSEAARSGRATCPTPIPTSHASDLAAQRFGISGRTIRRVKEAMENAKAAEVKEDILLPLQTMQLTPNEILNLSKQPKDVQESILREGNPKKAWREYAKTVDPAKVVEQVDAVVKTGKTIKEAFAAVALATGRSVNLIGRTYSVTKEQSHYKCTATHAWQFVEMCKGQLNRIQDDDPEKEKEIARLEAFIAELKAKWAEKA